MIGAHWLKREVVFVGVCGGGEVALTGHQTLRLHTERKMQHCKVLNYPHTTSSFSSLLATKKFSLGSMGK